MSLEVKLLLRIYTHLVTSWVCFDHVPPAMRKRPVVEPSDLGFAEDIFETEDITRRVVVGMRHGREVELV